MKLISKRVSHAQYMVDNKLIKPIKIITGMRSILTLGDGTVD
jgi:hypothetical protein